ncbi:MAG: hypothetical protein K8S97_09070 [Anaerolineae bacterium]|nr:hypothetical protein [Anaerolineae bacterium]
MRTHKKALRLLFVLMGTLVLSAGVLTFGHVTADAENFIQVADVAMDCNTGLGVLDYDYSILAGSRAVFTIEGNDEWGEYSISYEMVYPESINGSPDVTIMIEGEGYITESAELFYPDGTPASTTHYYAECPSGEAHATFAHTTQHSPVPRASAVQEEVPVPGCDATLNIPSTAVGGVFVADAPIYWAPGQLTSPLVTINAGSTARVIGVDYSEAYYQILWHCQLLWVPVDTIAPNPDAVWNDHALPARIVE